MDQRTQGLHMNCWFLCSVVALVCSDLALAAEWVDPELLALGMGSSSKQGDCSSLEHCQNELSVCKKLKTQIDGSTAQDVIKQMSLVVGNWMYLAGMQNFELPAGEQKSVPLVLTLTDMDLKTINTYLNQPTPNNFMTAVPILNRLFTVKRMNFMSPSNLLDNNGQTLLETKEKWVQIIFNVIIGCMNQETMLVLTCLVMGFVILKAMIFGANPSTLITMFILAVFFAGFLWNWAYMYQKAVVEQHVKRVKYEKYASSCQPDDSFWGFVKNLFGYVATIDECTEYFRGVQIDPLIMVPPTLALSETISMFIIHPSMLMAEAMAKISRILFGNMVGGMYFGTPLVMLIFGGMFVIFFILVTGRRVRLKLIYLGSIEVGSQFERFFVAGPGQEAIRDAEPCQVQRGDDSFERPRVQRSQSENGSSENPSGTSNTETNASSSDTAPGRESSPAATSSASADQASHCASAAPCCSVAHQPVCLRHRSVSHGCSAGHYAREDEPYYFGPPLGTDFSPRNPLLPRRRGDGGGGRQRPLRDVTQKWTNENLRNMTSQWTDANRGEMEEFIYTRRRKLSF